MSFENLYYTPIDPCIQNFTNKAASKLKAYRLALCAFVLTRRSNFWHFVVSGNSEGNKVWNFFIRRMMMR